MSKLSRRHCLQLLGMAAAAWGTPALPLWASAAGSPTPRPLFEPVPASTSGITWQHVNGRSPAYYLPETIGAGCAFLDYDNDGWMDIYLVNSGQCDFFTPSQPLRNALYRNNRDGTFTDVTEKAGVAGGGYGMGVAVGDYDGDGLPDLYVTQYGAQHPLPQQRRRHLHRRHREGRRGRRPAGPAAPSGSTTTTTAGSTCSSAASCDFDKAMNKSCGNPQDGRARLLHTRRCTSRPPAGCSTTTATAPLPTSRENPASAS